MSEFKNINFLLTGVGGQGVLLASDLIAETAMDIGYDVKKTDVHGMAQRGGSVSSHVRIGPNILSPIIPKGETDILMAMEKLEAIRWTPEVHSGAMALINNTSIPPYSVSCGEHQYPADEEISAALKLGKDKIFFLDANGVAASLGNRRAFNVVMVGFISYFLEIPEENWYNRLEKIVPAKVLELNKSAFAKGRDIAINSTKEFLRVV